MLTDLVRQAFAADHTANPANPANPRTSASAAGLRIVANACESSASAASIRSDSQSLATPAGRVFAGDSQDSQHSQGEQASDPRTTARMARLLRWGWTEVEARAVADRLALRDESDTRVTCIDCRLHLAGTCGDHRRAQLLTRTVSRDLAAMPQHCPAWQEAK